MRPALAAALLLVAGCASVIRQPLPPPAPPGAPEIRALSVREPVFVNGVDNDSAWRESPETEIPMEGRQGPGSCRVKAAVFRGTLNLLVRFEDPTDSKRRSHGFMSGPGEVLRWRFGSGDGVTVEFPISGPFPPDRVHPDRDVRDIWRWDNWNSDPSGHAEDLCSRNGDVRQDDCVLAEGGLTSRSAEDTLARGQWREGWWTVEFARALSTGFADDRDFTGLAEIPFRLVVRDQGGGTPREADSPVLRLLLPPPEFEPHGPLADPAGPSGTGR